MNAPQAIDFGTPVVGAGNTVTLDIDGIEVSVPAGTSLLRAAAEAGVMIPKLCATDIVKPFGSCRLCLVEIEGRRGYPSSCTTPAEAPRARGEGRPRTRREGGGAARRR